MRKIYFLCSLRGDIFTRCRNKSRNHAIDERKSNG